jgi:hypothetical protein
MLLQRETERRRRRGSGVDVPDDVTAVTIRVAVIQDHAFGSTPFFGTGDPALVRGVDTGLTDF